MLFRIGIENNVESRTLAWALEHPGCFAYGPDGDAALSAMPAAIHEYAAWLAAHTPESWLAIDRVELRVDETWECYSIDDHFERAADGYEVNAWFLHDWKPLTAEDVARGLKLLDFSRKDLLDTVGSLDAQTLDRKHSNERWSIAGIVRHVGGAEWWYLDRLGLAFPQEEVPKDPFERLPKVRARLVEVLPAMVDSKQVAGVDGELWSPRKLLRRAVWHERDHVEHIRKLLSQ